MSIPDLESEIRRKYLDRLDDHAWGEAEPMLDFGVAALPYFMAAFEREVASDRRACLVRVISHFRSPTALPMLATALCDKAREVWTDALDGIVALGGPPALDILKKAREAPALDQTETEKLEWIEEAIAQLTNCFYPI